MGAGTSAMRACNAWPMLSRARSSPECAHRNRPVRYDGRVVVTLCADDVLYLPVTTEISSLSQLTRRAITAGAGAPGRGGHTNGQSRSALEERGEAVTSRAVAAAAHISPSTTCTWRRPRETGALEWAAALSVVQ
jgi:hypothetical protein